MIDPLVLLRFGALVLLREGAGNLVVAESIFPGFEVDFYTQLLRFGESFCFYISNRNLQGLRILFGGRRD